MSLDKAIEHGKEKRKPYYDCRKMCCCHGVGCVWNTKNHLHNTKRRKEVAVSKIKEVEYDYKNNE